MKNTLFILCCLMSALSLNAQFLPGEMGYTPTQQQPFAEMHVKTMLSTMIDADGWTVPYAMHFYNTNGWLEETRYLQDSTLAEEERSPDMIDYYTYYPDGRIHFIEMEGYDALPIKYGFEYDKKNRLTALIIASAEAREFTYTYDKNNLPVRRNGKMARWVYKDENDTEGKLEMVSVEQTDYNWDDNGRLVGQTLWYMNEWTNRTAYQYNDKGQLTSSAVYYDNSDVAIPAFITTYFYYENGLPEKIKILEDGFEVTYMYTYTYY